MEATDQYQCLDSCGAKALYAENVLFFTSPRSTKAFSAHELVSVEHALCASTPARILILHLAKGSTYHVCSNDTQFTCFAMYRLHIPLDIHAIGAAVHLSLQCSRSTASL